VSEMRDQQQVFWLIFGLKLPSEIYASYELSVDLDKTGQVLGVGILRDIPSVSGPAAVAVRSWVYTPARLNGKPVASTLTINIVYNPGFLGADNIPCHRHPKFSPSLRRIRHFFRRN
jgi:hypothetical protein